jgi:NCS2 family nucleobase:cation symporter-2
MPTKPANLIYGVDDKPLWSVSAILGLQHVFSMSSTLVLPVIIAREIGAGFGVIQAMVCFSMIAAGLGTILQAIHRGPVGSGYLCANLCGPSVHVGVDRSGLDRGTAPAARDDRGGRII